MKVFFKILLAMSIVCGTQTHANSNNNVCPKSHNESVSSNRDKNRETSKINSKYIRLGHFGFSEIFNTLGVFSSLESIVKLSPKALKHSIKKSELFEFIWKWFEVYSHGTSVLVYYNVLGQEWLEESKDNSTEDFSVLTLTRQILINTVAAGLHGLSAKRRSNDPSHTTKILSLVDVFEICGHLKDTYFYTYKLSDKLFDESRSTNQS